MDSIWSGIGNYFTGLKEPVKQYEEDWQAYLYPTDDLTRGSAAGYGSNIRHGAAASALSNIMAEKLHNTFATPGYEGEPSGLFKAIGNVGAMLPMTFHELDPGAMWSGFKEGPSKKWLQNQTTEDILANLFGIMHGGESTDPNVEAETLKPELAYNKGIINNALLNIAKARGYDTRYDLQSELEQKNMVVPHRKDEFNKNPWWSAHMMSEEKGYPTFNKKVNIRDEKIGQNLTGRKGLIKDPQGLQDANPNRGFTRTKYGKAYRYGGIVSLL